MSPFIVDTFALLPAKPEFGQAVSYILLGFLIVMIVLGLMWLGTWSVGLLFKSIDQRHASMSPSGEVLQRQTVTTAAAVTVAQQDAGAAVPPSGEDYNRLVAVIAAAAQAAVGRSARVVSIKRSTGEWSAEGRRQIFDSRRVR